MSDETMMWDEVADIGTLLHELDDQAFDTPSLCGGAPRADQRLTSRSPRAGR